MINCPNCGAPAQGQFCGYCGTPLFTATDAVHDAQGKACHVWFENENGTIECFDMYLRFVDMQPEFETLYSDMRPVTTIITHKDVELRGELLDFDREQWSKVIDWQADRYSKREEV